MNVKKKKRNNWWIYLVIALAIVISVPIIIMLLYQNIPARGCKSGVFTANDILAYCGTVLSMSGAILGVFFSLRYSQKQYREDTLKRVLPFITLQDFDFSEKGIFSTEADKCLISGKAYLIIDSEGFIDSQGFIPEDSLPDELKKSIGFDFSDKSGIHKKTAGFYPKILINVGIGTAVNCMLAVCKAAEKNKRMASPIDFSLLPGQKLFIGVCIDGDPQKFKMEKFLVRIYYYDIFGTSYNQEWTFQLSGDGLIADTSIRQEIEKV